MCIVLPYHSYNKLIVFSLNWPIPILGSHKPLSRKIFSPLGPLMSWSPLPAENLDAIMFLSSLVKRNLRKREPMLYNFCESSFWYCLQEAYPLCLTNVCINGLPNVHTNVCMSCLPNVCMSCLPNVCKSCLPHVCMNC